MELSSVILTTGSSFGFFTLVNATVSKLPMPDSARRNAWKWRNIATSFVHSSITAVWAVLWYVQPKTTTAPHSSFYHTEARPRGNGSCGSVRSASSLYFFIPASHVLSNKLSFFFFYSNYLDVLIITNTIIHHNYYY